MAIETFRRSLTTTASLLYQHPIAKAVEGDFNAKNVALVNISGVDVVLGDSNVTATAGARWPIAAGRTLTVTLEPGEALYGIVASGTADVDVLVNGR